MPTYTEQMRIQRFPERGLGQFPQDFPKKPPKRNQFQGAMNCSSSSSCRVELSPYTLHISLASSG